MQVQMTAIDLFQQPSFVMMGSVPSIARGQQETFYSV